jgi:futalosine hydrolase
MCVLVVAASSRELSEIHGAETLCCGIGPVEAAAATSRRLSVKRYTAVIHVGIAGARSLEPGSVVIGSESIYADIIAPQTTLPRVSRLTAGEALLRAAVDVLPEAAVMPIATAGRVGGGLEQEVEAMEGFGVLRAAALASVPALEVRAISNSVEVTDRAAWQTDEALATLHRVTPLLIEAARGISWESAALLAD